MLEMNSMKILSFENPKSARATLHNHGRRGIWEVCEIAEDGTPGAIPSVTKH